MEASGYGRVAYDSVFAKAIAQVKAEGRYRCFAEIRPAGAGSGGAGVVALALDGNASPHFRLSLPTGAGDCTL